MSQAARIINAKFGGIRPAARLLDVPWSTVASWVRCGFIPAKRHAHVMATARANGIALDPADFFDGPVNGVDHDAA